MNPYLSFADAVYQMRNGRKVTRKGWNGQGMYVALQVPDENSANTAPYFYMKNAQGLRHPWTITNSDVLTDDWEVVPEMTASPTNENVSAPANGEAA